MEVGLVVCGRWGRLILRDLNALGCEVTVVARSAESSQRASEGGAADVVSSVDALLKVKASSSPCLRELRRGLKGSGSGRARQSRGQGRPTYSRVRRRDSSPRSPNTRGATAREVEPMGDPLAG